MARKSVPNLSDFEDFDDLADLGFEQAKPEEPAPATNPTQHRWGSNTGTFDMSKLKPHRCMVNLHQRGNYIHCRDGNHGMRIPAGKILVKTPDGWNLDDVTVLNVDSKGNVVT